MEYQIKFDSLLLTFPLESAVSGEILPKKTTKKTTEKTTKKILRQINEKNTISMNEMAEKLSISYHTIDWNIRKLRKEDVIKRIGPDKGGYWKVVNK